MSSLWLCSSLAPGLDSTSSPSSRQASPNTLPLGVPVLSVPIWQPATPGSTPSVSFHHVVVPAVQSWGLNSKVPMAPAISRASDEGLERSEQACSIKNRSIRGINRFIHSLQVYSMSGTNFGRHYEPNLWNVRLKSVWMKFVRAGAIHPVRLVERRPPPVIRHY